MYLHENLRLFQELLFYMDRDTQYGRSYIVKDYFAVSFLKEAIRSNSALVFKGGTCLSKCYKVIDRFSEDVDLGMDCEHATEGMRKRMKQAVVDACKTMGLEITNLAETRSRREYNRFEIALPSSLELEADSLLVETAVMTPSSPSQPMEVQSFIGEYCTKHGFDDVLEDYNLVPFTVLANSLERTFCDKVFAICDYYLSGDIPQRQSRHIYDLYKLSDALSFDENLENLLSVVRQQRQGLFRCYSAEQEINVSEVLHTIIAEASYKEDYESLTIPLLYEDVPYTEAISTLETIAIFAECLN